MTSPLPKAVKTGNAGKVGLISIPTLVRQVLRLVPAPWLARLDGWARARAQRQAQRRREAVAARSVR